MVRIFACLFHDGDLIGNNVALTPEFLYFHENPAAFFIRGFKGIKVGLGAAI